MKNLKQKKEVELPDLLTWKQVGEIIHCTSYNGVIAFGLKNKLNAFKLQKNLLFDKKEVCEAIERNRVKLSI
jgi:hypothetical protein